MEVNEICTNIKKWAQDIEQYVYLLDAKGVAHLKNYKLADLQEIDKYIKVCIRCGSTFVPNYNYRQWQIYCCKQCRDTATRDNKFILKLDKEQKAVDLLRKSIYERRYRAKRDNKAFNEQAFSILQKKLSILVKQRKTMKSKQFYNELDTLYDEYYRLTGKSLR